MLNNGVKYMLKYAKNGVKKLLKIFFLWCKKYYPPIILKSRYFFGEKWKIW